MKYFIIISPSRSGHNFIKNVVKSWFRPALNIEIHDYENVNPLKFNKNINLSENEYTQSIKIILTRDLLNWFSSYFYFFINGKCTRNNYIIDNVKWENEKNPTDELNPDIVYIPDHILKRDFINFNEFTVNPEELLESALDNWFEISKEYIGSTNFLPEFQKVYYDSFFTNKIYRINLCNNLNGIYNEDNLNIMSFNPNHSSFDGPEFDGNTQKMKVLERYKNILNIKDFQRFIKIIKEHKALDFYLNNFEIDDDKKIFINEYFS